MLRRRFAALLMLPLLIPTQSLPAQALLEVAAPTVAGGITVTVEDRTPAAGDRVRVTGHVAGPATPTRVTIQKRVGPTWVKASRTVSTQRGYRLRIRVAAGRAVYRVVGERASGPDLRSAPLRLRGEKEGTEGTTGDSPIDDGFDLAGVQARILADTNGYRVQAGLAPLTMTRAMNAVATTWSQDMAGRKTMDHNPSYASQMPPGWTRAGENVAYGYAYTDVTKGWYDSPGHRANLLGDYTTIGIGAAKASDGRFYYTQNFGKY